MTERIVEEVSGLYGLEPSELRLHTNRHSISRPRQVAMYLIRKLTCLSLQRIGRIFAGFHHTTVMYAVERIESRIQHDRRFAAEIEQMKKKILA